LSRNRNKKAFTIVELVIVIAVIAILATVLVPAFGDVIQNAKDSAAKQEAKNAYTSYMVENAGKGEMPELFLYVAKEGRVVAIQKGAVIGIYASEDAALSELIGEDYDESELKPTTDGKLFSYGGVVPTTPPSEPGGPGEPSNPYAGKVISILGDSISTLEGYIPVADGFNLKHRTRYVVSADQAVDGLLCMHLEQTWWMRVINGLDAKLGINDSWAGSCVTNKADSNSGDTGKDACMASLTRIQNLGANGTPDVIMFYGGTNDIAHCKSNNYTLGSFDAAAAPTQADLSQYKWDTVVDAYVEALLRIKYFYPNAQIIAMLPTYTTSYYNNDQLNQYNILISAICEHYGVTYVDLRTSGISISDLVDGIHPNAKGMEYIADAVLNALEDSEVQTSGENVVYKISHALNGVTASKHYYKGVSQSAAFVETLTGTNFDVTVTMGGVDITASCFANGEISIDYITGDIVITAKSAVPDWYSHVQQRPEGATATTNLWTALTPENAYYAGTTTSYDATTWNSGAPSITVPIVPGELIYASSFGGKDENGNLRDGIRVAFFLSDGTVLSYAPGDVHTMYKDNGGYIVAPENAVAVCIPLWPNNVKKEVYIGEAVKNHDLIKRLQQLPNNYAGENLWNLLDATANEYYT